MQKTNAPRLKQCEQVIVEKRKHLKSIIFQISKQVLTVEKAKLG